MNAMGAGSGVTLPTGLSGEGGIVVVEASGGEALDLPAGRWILGADFVRQGPDLLLVGEGGERLLIKGYFAQAEAPDLVLADGARLNGDLVLKLAGPVAPGAVAQAGPAATAEAIGKVETVEGTVTVRHADGQEAVLHKGDPVFQGDVLETGPAGALGVIFADQSTFSLAQSARMTLDEMVYDPGAQVGSFKATLVQGVFSFISGQIAKTGPEAMSIDTPMATVGIRGTTGAINLPQGQPLTVVLTTDAGGTVGEITVLNAAGVQILNQPFQATNVAGLNLPPSTTFTMSAEQFNSTFAQAVAALPPSPSSGGGNGGSGGDQQGNGDGGDGGDGGQQADAGQQGDGQPGDGAPGAGTGEPGTGLEPAGEGPVGPVVGPVTANLGALAGLTGLSQETIATVVNDVINNLVNNLLAGPMGDQMGGLFGGPMGDQFGPGQFVGDMIGKIVGGAIGDDNGGDDGGDDGYVFYDLFDRKVVATTGDDNLVDDDTSTQFVMAQGGEGAPIDSNSLGGDDTVDGGGGADQITFDNLWQVSGRLDGALSKITLWNWTDNTPLNPEDSQLASVEEVDATVTISGIDLFLFRSYEFYGYPNNGGALQVPNFAMGGEAVGEIVVGGAGDDTINGDETWFQDADAVVVGGGAGNDVIYGASGDYSWNSLSGGAGDDELYALHGQTNMLDGGDGDDMLTCGAQVGATLDGGAGADTFNIINASGRYAVSGGESVIVVDAEIVGEDIDTVDYSQMGSSVTFTLQPENVTTSHGGQGSGILVDIERLQGSNSGDTYNLSGTLSSIFDSITAGDGDNTFNILSSAVVDIAIDGGAGNDTYNIYAGSTVTVGIDGGDGDDTLNLIGGTFELSISNVETVNGSSGNDSLTVDGALNEVVVDLGEGTDSLTLSLPDGDEARLILSGVESLTLADIDPDSSSYLFFDHSASGLTVDMGDGYDELVLASVQVEMTFESNDVTLRNVETVYGGEGDDTVTFAENLDATSEVNVDLWVGDNDTVILAAGDNTVALSNVDLVVGSDIADSLTLTDSISEATIDLGDGVDVLNLAEESSNDVILVDVEQVNGSVDYDEGLTLNGPAIGVTIDLGEGGSDTLSLADGGGNAVTAVNVEEVWGGGGADSITIGADNLDDVVVIGGGGADVLTREASEAPATLTVHYESVDDFGDTISGFDTVRDLLSFNTGNIAVTGSFFAQMGDAMGWQGGCDSVAVIAYTPDFGSYNVASAVADDTTGIQANPYLSGLVSGDAKLFAVGGSGSTQLWYWQDTGTTETVGADTYVAGSIDAAELTAVAGLQGVDQADLTADDFDGFSGAVA